jgi:hypothetical protein
MMFNRRQRGQILILLGGWLLFGGSASSVLVVYDRPSSEMKKAIKRVITDSGRKDTILSELKYWKSVQKDMDKSASRDRKNLLDVVGRKSSQLSDVEPITSKLDETFLKMDRNFLDLRFRVKNEVTSAEWAEIVARPDR